MVSLGVSSGVVINVSMKCICSYWQSLVIALTNWQLEPVDVTGVCQKGEAVVQWQKVNQSHCRSGEALRVPGG